MTDIYEQLSEVFPPEKVHWRVGSTWGDDSNKQGIALAYIDARDVMQRLDEVVGPANWQDTYDEKPSGRVVCELSLLVEIALSNQSSSLLAVHLIF